MNRPADGALPRTVNFAGTVAACYERGVTGRARGEPGAGRSAASRVLQVGG